MDNYLDCNAMFPNKRLFQLGYVKDTRSCGCWIDGTFKLHYGCSEAEIDQAFSTYFDLVRRHVKVLLQTEVVSPTEKDLSTEVSLEQRL